MYKIIVLIIFFIAKTSKTLIRYGMEEFKRQFKAHVYNTQRQIMVEGLYAKKFQTIFNDCINCSYFVLGNNLIS